MNSSTERSTVRALAVGLAIFALLAGCDNDNTTTPQNNNNDGFSGVADCMNCHGDSTWLKARMDQWGHSLHASQDILWETNQGGGCNGRVCHTSEGFVTNLAGNVQTPSDPTPIGCRTCHSPHTNKDFRLRTQDAYTLLNGVTFDHGKGNLCAHCHHSRMDVRTIPAPNDTFRVASAFFGPHESAQSDIFQGTGGYTFGRPDTLPSSPHRNVVADACVQCHMFFPVGTNVGGHTWKLASPETGDNVKVCNQASCHGGEQLTDFDRPATRDWDRNGTVEGVQTEFEGLLDSLRTELVHRGLLTGSGADSNRAVPGLRKGREAGAVYNFRLAVVERSNGIHNTKYIMNLMTMSLDSLRATPPAARSRQLAWR